MPAGSSSDSPASSPGPKYGEERERSASPRRAPARPLRGEAGHDSSVDEGCRSGRWSRHPLSRRARRGGGPPPATRARTTGCSNRIASSRTARSAELKICRAWVTEARVSTSAMSSAARFRTMACGVASCAAWPRWEARCTRESGTVGVSTGNGRPANRRRTLPGLRSTPTTLASATPMSTSTSLTLVRRGGSAVITGLSMTSRPTSSSQGPRPESSKGAGCSPVANRA